MCEYEKHNAIVTVSFLATFQSKKVSGIIPAPVAFDVSHKEAFI